MATAPSFTKEFNVGNLEGTFQVGGWGNPPRYKACYGSEQLTRKVDEHDDGLGAEAYAKLMQEAEERANSTRRGAYFIGTIKFEIAPDTTIPKAFKERVERRLRKGGAEDEVSKKATRARSAVRAKNASCGLRSRHQHEPEQQADAPAAASSSSSPSSMPPPSAPLDKEKSRRAALLRINLEEFVPAAMASREARLYDVPAEDVVLMKETPAPVIKREPEDSAIDSQDLPPPLAQAPAPSASQPPSIRDDGSALFQRCMAELPTPLRNDPIVASMAESAGTRPYVGVSSTGFTPLGSQNVEDFFAKMTPGSMHFPNTPAHQSTPLLQRMLTPLSMLPTTPALGTTPDPSVASSPARASIKRPDTGDHHNALEVLALISPINGDRTPSATAATSKRQKTDRPRALRSVQTLDL